MIHLLRDAQKRFKIHCSKKLDTQRKFSTENNGNKMVGKIKLIKKELKCKSRSSNKKEFRLKSSRNFFLSFRTL